MLKNYMLNLESWFRESLPLLSERKYFLCTLGGIFLLGIVSKCIVMMSYKKLIKKADNMTFPKSKTLRQIKMKFESVKTVNGVVANPMLLVKRYINKCKLGVVTLNNLDRVAGWCALICIAYGGIIGYALYTFDYGKTTAMAYILVAGFFGMTLLTAQQCIKTEQLQNELTYIITDFLENNMNFRERVKTGALAGDESEIRIVNEEGSENIESLNENSENINLQMANINTVQQDSEEMDNVIDEENIINEVLGQFLQ